jgi:predicted O-methyltransferase YrrM
VTAATEPALAAALAATARVEGWLSDDQAARLWARARVLRAPARIVEIGSFRGRSTIVLATAAPVGVEVVAIDPHAGNDRGPQHIHGTTEEGEADHRVFLANLDRAGVASRVRHVRHPSQSALGEVPGDIDLLFVDGAHRYRPARDDLARWGARVAPGGAMLVHDAFTSIGVTLAQLRLLCFGREFRYAGRSRSLAEYQRRPVVGRARLINAARQLAQFPWFARTLAVKLALAARAPRLARALGWEEWPY